MTSEAVLEHYELRDRFHEFVFHEGTRAAVERWADRIEQLQLEHRWYNQTHLDILLDAHSATPFALRHLFEVLADYNRAYEGLEPPTLKIAFVHHPDEKILSIYETFGQLLDPPVEVAYFIDRDAALAWLQHV